MPATSTNMDRSYLLSKFLPSITVYDDDAINQNPQIEIFTPSMVKILNNLVSTSYYSYAQEHIPVIARRRCGNTSCWWMIMVANGKNHPLIIEPGELLAIPDIAIALESTVVQSNNSLRVPVFTTI